MRFPRLRLNLRSLMLVILALGLALGLAARHRDRGRRRAFTKAGVMEQYEATQVILREAQERAGAQAEALGRRDRLAIGGGASSSSQSSGERWAIDLDVSYTIGPTAHPMVVLRLGGGAEGVDLGPIVIIDRGGELNAQVIEWLGREYRDKGWPFRVERISGASPGRR